MQMHHLERWHPEAGTGRSHETPWTEQIYREVLQNYLIGACGAVKTTPELVIIYFIDADFHDLQTQKTLSKIVSPSKFPVPVRR